MYKWSCALFYFVAVFAVIVDGQPTTGDCDDHSVDRLYESVAMLQAKVAVLEAELNSLRMDLVSNLSYIIGTLGHTLSHWRNFTLKSGGDQWRRQDLVSGGTTIEAPKEPSGVGYGEGCPLPSRLGGLRELSKVVVTIKSPSSHTKLRLCFILVSARYSQGPL